jgi:outer membrane biosynthesis protein TonB
MPRESTIQSYTSEGYTGQGYLLSVMLHVGIVAVAWTGLPFMHRDIPKEAPLIVDLVPIEEITSAAPRPTPEIAPDPQPITPEPPKPEPAAEPPPAEAIPPPKPDPIPEKEPEKVPEPTVKPPPPKPTPPKTKQDDAAMLQKLLKDMQKSQPKPKQQATADSKAPPTNNVAPNVSDHASMSELDAIRRHIEGCWRIDPGKEGLENLSVEVKVFINPDGSVREAQFVDMARYFADTAFRTLANSARNAVLGCGNIPISPERYNTFKEITMTFSPQGRIN